VTVGQQRVAETTHRSISSNWRKTGISLMRILLMLPNRAQMSYSACQIGPSVSYWFQWCGPSRAVLVASCQAKEVLSLVPAIGQEALNNR
jgi:hypothetical protein